MRICLCIWWLAKARVDNTQRVRSRTRGSRGAFVFTRRRGAGESQHKVAVCDSFLTVVNRLPHAPYRRTLLCRSAKHNPIFAEKQRTAACGALGFPLLSPEPRQKRTDVTNTEIPTDYRRRPLLEDSGFGSKSSINARTRGAHPYTAKYTPTHTAPTRLSRNMMRTSNIGREKQKQTNHMLHTSSALIDEDPPSEDEDGEEERGRSGSSRWVRVSCPMTSPEGDDKSAASASSRLKPIFTKESTRCSTFQSALVATCVGEGGRCRG